MAKTQRAARPAVSAKPAPPPVPWPQILGEFVLLALIALVPIAINRNSQNLVDIKDVILGLGVVIGLSVWLVVGLAQGRVSWVRSRLTLLIFLYLAWTGLSALLSHYWWASITEYGHLLANVGLYCLALVSLRRSEQVGRIGLTICAVMVPVSIYAIAQATGHDFISWSSGAGERVFSFLANPTYLGGFLMLTLPLLVALLWPGPEAEAQRPASPAPVVFQGFSLVTLAVAFFLPCAGLHFDLVPLLVLQYSGLTLALIAVYLTYGAAPLSPRVRRVLLALAIVLAIWSLYLSYTLAAYIGLLLGTVPAFGLVVLRGGRRIMRGAAIGVVSAVIVFAPVGLLAYRHLPPPEQQRVLDVIHLKDPTAAERQLHWHVAAQLFREHPAFGLGYGAFRIYSMRLMERAWYAQQKAPEQEMFTPAYAHNEYLQVLSDTGVVGGALFLALLVTFYWMTVRVALRHPEAIWRRLALAAAVAVTAFLFQNAVGVTFRQSGASIFFWLWLAIMAVGHSSLPDSAAGQVAVPHLRRWHFAGSPPAAAGAVLVAGLALYALWTVAIPPTIAGTTLKEARALAAMGRYEEAYAAARATVEMCPYSGFGYYTLAYAAGQLARYQEAAEANERALQLSPDNASMCYNLAVSYRDEGKPDEARKGFEKSIELMPVAQNYLGLITLEIKQGKVDEAERLTRQALQANPGDARLKQVLSDIEQSRRRAPLTLADVQKLAQQQPQNPVLQHQLVLMFLARKQYQAALEPARRWTELEPKSGDAQGAVGACYYSLGDFAAAQQAFARALALDPSLLRARLGLAYTYGKMGRSAEAIRELTTVAEKGGGSKEGKEAKALLEKLAKANARPQPPAP